jgi:NAD(P)H-nitrite reductase large subunit
VDVSGTGNVADVSGAEHRADGSEPDRLAREVVTRRRAALVRRRTALRTFAAGMARVYPMPTSWQWGLDDATVVCRCEEVTAGAIRQAARQDGASDARAAKLLVRAGMGYCQGRICGYATECLAAATAGRAPEHRPVERPVAVPLPLGLVATRDC